MEGFYAQHVLHILIVKNPIESTQDDSRQTIVYRRLNRTPKELRQKETPKKSAKYRRKGQGNN